MREHPFLHERPDSKIAPYLVGCSPIMRQVHRRIERLAETDTTVLLYGETGSGKELAAEAIHRFSPRSRGPLVKIPDPANPQMSKIPALGMASFVLRGLPSRPPFHQARCPEILLRL